MNSLYCSLCGNNNHPTSEGHYAMKNDAGRVVPVTPAKILCSICEKKINKKLYHPIKFCFNRNKPQEFQKEQTLYLTITVEENSWGHH